MSTTFIVAASSNPVRYQVSVAKGDRVTYDFDFRPWQEDNSPVTSIEWGNEQGQTGITNQVLTDGIASALLTFNESGRSLISITAISGEERKKIWLEILARDLNYLPDDYGINE